MSRVCSNTEENAAEMDELISQEIEIKGDQFNEENQADAALLNLNYTDLWALGLSTAIGGHFFAWTSALSTGFGTYIVSLTVLSTAYFILMMCISELSSALPFAGGVYGLARVTLGIYPGYLVAVNDTIKSILATSTAAYYVGAIIATATDTNEEMYYLYWALFYIYCLAVNVFGGRTFWRINKASALISVVFLIIYIFGVIRYVDFNENVPLRGEEGDDRWFKGGMYAYMQNIGGTARFYTGIQSINLACGQMKRPKTDVPKAYLGIMTTLVCTSFVLSFLASAMPPGVNRIMKLSFPLTPGFAKIFDILPKKAVLLTLPPSFFYGSTYLYYCGQQMSAMSRSGLLNALFGKELPVRKTPVYSLLAGTIISYIVCVLRYHYAHVREQLFSVMVLVTMSTYIAILVSFILFRNYFPSIKRDFESPFGSAGAVYALIFFCLQLVSVVGFQQDQSAFFVFAVLFIVVSIYYYLVVRHRQVFSEEEKTVMFTAYVVKGNHEKAARMKKGVQTRLRLSSKPAPPPPPHLPTPTPTATTPSPAQALPAHADSFVGSQAEDSHAASSRMEDGTHKEGNSVEIVTTTSPDGSLMPFVVSVAATTPRNRFKERKE